jgi:glutamate---cysteine ligase / carboxylate-amine ligase
MEEAMSTWADWNFDGRPWTIGIEEEAMLVSPETWLPASRCEDVLAAASPHLRRSARSETHGSALELITAPHGTVGAAIAELAVLREQLAGTLTALGLRAAASGTHPVARWEDSEVSPGARYQFLHASMRELARREPTFGLHVHVAIPDPEAAVRALNALRPQLPLLLALSANSPFWQGRDSGMASARTPAFQSFPRTGVPRRFDDYAHYVEAIDVLLRCDAIPEPTFLWWDARLQPRLGTLEVRIMDAQTRIEDTAALAALVQCMVRRYALGPVLEPTAADAREVVDENRFIAARDGMDAAFVDPPAWGRRPAGDLLAAQLTACAGHARALDCVRELAQVPRLAESPGAARQRRLAWEAGTLEGLLRALSDAFVAPVPA